MPARKLGNRAAGSAIGVAVPTPPKRVGLAPLCAICVSDPATTTTLLDGVEYRVCSDCDSAPIRAYDATRGYEVPTGGGSQATIRQAADRVSRAAAPNRFALESGRLHAHQSNPNARSLTSGYLMIRVRRRAPDGKARDFREAFAEIAHHAWANEVRFVATGPRWHIFERPDPAVAAAQRVPSSNPLVAIEQYRAVSK